MEKKTKKQKKSIEFDFRKIKSYEDACKFTNVDPQVQLPDVSKVPQFLKNYVLAAFRLAYSAFVLRNGSKLNWANGSIKFEPWHWIKADKEHPSGFGFSRSNFTGAYTSSVIGSRLSMEKYEKALHFAENFQDDWKYFKLEIE